MKYVLDYECLSGGCVRERHPRLYAKVNQGKADNHMTVCVGTTHAGAFVIGSLDVASPGILRDFSPGDYSWLQRHMSGAPHFVVCVLVHFGGLRQMWRRNHE